MARRRDLVLLPASDPRAFGPPVWHALHVLAESFQERPSAPQRRQWRRFLRSLASLLPCPRCGEHFRRFCAEYDLRIATRSRAALRSFLVAAHANAGSRHAYAGDPVTDYGFVAET